MMHQTGLVSVHAYTQKQILSFSHPLRDANISRRVLRGVKEPCCPLSQSYWAVMTLEDVRFFLFTSVI